MKIINFGMHGWVIGKATLEAHPFTMNLFDVYCIGEIVNHHSHSFLFVSPCIIIVPPCILVVKLHFLNPYTISFQKMYTFIHLRFKLFEIHGFKSKMSSIS